MDLAKVGEVRSFIAALPEGAVQNAVNEKLSAGWVLVSAKVVESDKRDRFVQPAIVVYVLGRPRERQNLVSDPEHQKWLRDKLEYTARVSAKAGVPLPIGMELEETDAWLKQHLPSGDPDHPVMAETIGQVFNYPADEGRGGTPQK